MITAKIVKASSKDIRKIIDIEELSYKDPWPREVFIMDYLFNSSALYYIAKTENKIVGFIGIWLEPTRLHIINVAVHPEYRNEGVGTQLLLFAINYAKERKFKEVSLEVRKSNENAIRLYKKLGFEVVEDLKAYYQDGEDGYRLFKNIEET